MREEENVFRRYLVREERGKAAIEKYLRDVRRFLVWLDGGRRTRRRLSAGRRSSVRSVTAP